MIPTALPTTLGLVLFVGINFSDFRSIKFTYLEIFLNTMQMITMQMMPCILNICGNLY